jgi:hypothetical protein
MQPDSPAYGLRWLGRYIAEVSGFKPRFDRVVGGKPAPR